MSKKRLRILLAEGDPAETTASLRELYPESQGGLELTIVSTIPTLIATLNRDRGPWGPLELCMNARFWSPKEAITFSEFLDSVAAGLRLPAMPFANETASRKKSDGAEKR